MPRWNRPPEPSIISCIPAAYRSYVEQYSREYDVDENLVYAVAKVESNFDPNAVSSADARGLMQMTEDAFEWVQYRMGDQSGVTYADIFDPEVAIKYGTYMLHLLLTETGDEMLAICSYHAGMATSAPGLNRKTIRKTEKHLTKYPILIQNGIIIKSPRQRKFTASFILKKCFLACSLLGGRHR